ncbi:hypothetical protein OVA24_14135 [Luteolibacter sp. SL250]|uniref:hypothetical protein n=1 Tax=Luteolibacter sp. SL250 TaxID=2995170 RepID=UPI00226E2F75|nr:hypothetical protein [Luteolibacter sp. SL250]WAC18373.1 hypothetical protein OVA24_14135 [Luteolibacter sp. SL250]
MSNAPGLVRSWPWMVGVAVAFAGGFALSGAMNVNRLEQAETESKDRQRKEAWLSLDEETGKPGRSMSSLRSKADDASGGRVSIDAKIAKTIRMKNPADRISAWVREVDGMTAENALAYLNALDASDPQAKKQLEWQILIRRWMELDPAGCARHIASLPVETKTQFAIDVAMNKWTETDLGAAAAFIETLKGTALYNSALHSHIGRIGTSDLQTAMSMADRAWKDNPEKYNWMMERLHGEFRFANQGGDSRVFFDSIPTAEGKAAAFGHVFFRLWNNSPDEAADWLVTQPDFASGAAVRRIVNLKNAAAAGSGDTWKTEHFPQVDITGG